jgi:hypothetical protein
MDFKENIETMRTNFLSKHFIKDRLWGDLPGWSSKHILRTQYKEQSKLI